jgi:hypothetical protein
MKSVCSRTLVVDGSSNVADVTLFAGSNQLIFTAGRPRLSRACWLTWTPGMAAGP